MTLRISVAVPFCKNRPDTANLRKCLLGLWAQTRKPHEVILMDDSHPDDRAEVRQCLKDYRWSAHVPIRYLEFPYVGVNAPAWSRKFNAAHRIAKGDAFHLLCSNWSLEPEWIQKMGDWLEDLGPGNVVSADNARKNMGDESGNTYDFFAAYPDRFEAPSFYHIDEGFLTILHMQDWVDFDEDFDPKPDDLSETKGAWHAVSEWGYRLIVKNGCKLWIRRDMKAEHADYHPHPGGITQTYASEALMREKGVP